MTGVPIPFAFEEYSDYMRLIKDTKTSFSLNYFGYSSNYVSNTIAGFGPDFALNAKGKALYLNGTNLDFGV